jgi:hypothetical protein
LYKKISKLDRANQEAIQSTLHVKSTFLHVPYSTSGRHLDHSVLQFLRAENTKQLKTQLKGLQKNAISLNNPPGGRQVSTKVPTTTAQSLKLN